MAFNSLGFLAFLTSVLTLYALVGRRSRNWLLLAASTAFYAFWDFRFVGLVALSVVTDWSIGKRLGGVSEGTTVNERNRRTLLWTSLALNLGILGFFKYANFFLGSLHGVAALLGVGFEPSALHIALPLGISFYTFRSISYVVDVYRSKLAPCRGLLDYANYVAFFPQISAGPIERASNFLPQLQGPRALTADNMTRGAYLILFGLAKKVAIADGLSSSVDAIFNAGHAPSAPDALLATWGFALQIYCDFSGYTDIARGVSKLFGFDPLPNFRTPYFSTNPQDFWDRWHISLSTWLRDYLYISLGGNRKGSFATYRNLMLTMILGGLWHGAAWHFVAWGVYQGALLVGHRLLTAGKRPAPERGPLAWLKAAAFFQLVCLGWLIFRAGEMRQVWEFCRSMFTLHDLASVTFQRPSLATLAGLGLLLALDSWQHHGESATSYRRSSAFVRGGVYAALLWIVVMGLTNAPASFIYVQF